MEEREYWEVWSVDVCGLYVHVALVDGRRTGKKVNRGLEDSMGFLK
jgi:hypothetical protein